MPVLDRSEIKLPKNFDPRKHAAQLERLVAEKLGPDWRIDHLDPARFSVIAVRENALTSVTSSNADTKIVAVAAGTKESDGDRLAEKFADQNPGFEMTQFAPTLGRAVLTRMTQQESRCRSAVAAMLSVKPWKVEVAGRDDGGFDLKLPDKFSAARHTEKLEDIATGDVGAPGWYVEVDSHKLTASIIPADPPTFPAALPFPMKQETVRPATRLEIGMCLPEPGEDRGDSFVLDLEDSHFVLTGLSGSGKSVFLNDVIGSALAAGFELAIIDVPAKAVDFAWCKDLVRPNGWGAGSPAAAAAVLGSIYDEGNRRADVLEEYGVKKYSELPASVRATMPYVLVIIDEVTGLFAKETEPKSLPKDHPDRVAAIEYNMCVDLIKSKVNKIAAELRFVGMRLGLSTQVASQGTGIEPKLRTNLQSKLLLGARATEGNRKLAFADPDSAPHVPKNIQDDKDAGRGTGVAQPEGAPSRVFKSFYADTDDLHRYLTGIGVPLHTGQEPSAALIDQYVPRLDGGDDAPTRGTGDGAAVQSVKNRKAMEAAAHIDPETGERLSAFEYANKQRAASVRKSVADKATGEGEVE